QWPSPSSASQGRYRCACSQSARGNHPGAALLAPATWYRVRREQDVRVMLLKPTQVPGEVLSMMWELFALVLGQNAAEARRNSSGSASFPDKHADALTGVAAAILGSFGLLIGLIATSIGL